MSEITVAALVPTGIRLEDLEAVNKLAKELSSGADPLTLEEARTLAKNHFLFVARFGGKEIVGMVTLVINRIPTKLMGHIEDVIVTEKHRGNGISKKLMEFAIETAQHRGLKHLDLTSRPEREEAQALYFSLGFEKRNTDVMRLVL